MGHYWLTRVHEKACWLTTASQGLVGESAVANCSQLLQQLEVMRNMVLHLKLVADDPKLTLHVLCDSVQAS